jgi:hypothetical protein
MARLVEFFHTTSGTDQRHEVSGLMQVGVKPQRRAVAEAVVVSRFRLPIPELSDARLACSARRFRHSFTGELALRGRSLDEPEVCSEIISVAEIDRRHVARKVR